VHCLTFDVRDKVLYLKLLIVYLQDFLIDVLINNAGNVMADPIQTGDIDDWDAMIDIMSKDFCTFQRLLFRK
jgi:NADP-dependent 3-hydroxy acid dehydrogenase YdfG